MTRDDATVLALFCREQSMTFAQVQGQLKSAGLTLVAPLGDVLTSFVEQGLLNHTGRIQAPYSITAAGLARCQRK